LQNVIGVGYNIPSLNCSIWLIDCSLKLNPSFTQQAESGLVSTGIVIFVPLSVSAIIFSKHQMIDHLDSAKLEDKNSIISTILLDVSKFYEVPIVQFIDLIMIHYY
jgi:hypothetical protein